MTNVPARGFRWWAPLWRNRRPASVLGVLVESVGAGLVFTLVASTFTDDSAEAGRYAALFFGLRLLVGVALLWNNRAEPYP